MPESAEDADSQDLAEVFDETNTTEDGYDIAHPDMARGVYDVTTTEDDTDENDPEDLDEFDPDNIDETDLESMLEEDDGVGEERELPADQEDLVSADDDSPADYQSEPETPSPRAVQEARLDSDLEATFPASDPFAIGPGAD